MIHLTKYHYYFSSMNVVFFLLHMYAMQFNFLIHLGLIPNSSHGAAAVMIVNPTTPNIVSTNMAQQYNVSCYIYTFITVCRTHFTNKTYQHIITVWPVTVSTLYHLFILNRIGSKLVAVHKWT